MDAMRNKEELLVPGPELDELFQAARQHGSVEIEDELRQSLLATAYELKPLTVATNRRPAADHWLSVLLDWAPVWKPAGLLAAFALFGFGFGLMFAQDIELMASEFGSSATVAPETDIIASLEQYLLEG